MDSDESEVRRRRQNPMRKMKTTGPAATIVTSQHLTVPSIGDLLVTPLETETRLNGPLQHSSRK
jgi:hypothetical protein